VEAVRLHRFDKVLFETPVDQLQGKLMEVRDEYGTDLLNLHPEDAAFMEMLQGFVSDPTMRDVYRLVDSVWGDMEPQARQIGEALQRAEALMPTLRYDKVYTFVSGMFDYNMRVGCNSHELVVSLDQYVLPYTKKYGYFGCPLFLVQQSRPEYMVADCITAIAREHIEVPQERDMSLLDYMVAEGKAVYFAQQVLDDAPDSILMRYTAQQTDWMRENEEHVWSYLLQNRLLYETDYMRFHNLVDDAPKTNAFRDSSPRTTDYIGWRIVSQYMKNSGSTMQELFDETDAQKILNQSNYRPGR
ncbi:MAG: hypothetical protein J5641_07470, partial [Bacteroidales bacterium]|nr:hypothetical protein [Bacteroidales bacterium]